MPWPSVAVDTTGMDNDTDVLPRSAILDLSTKFNELIAMRGVAAGVCDLDGSGLIPDARIPAAIVRSSALGTAAARNTGTGTDTVPLVGTKSATESLAGLVELATTGEMTAGAAGVVPECDKVKAYIDSVIAAIPTPAMVWEEIPLQSGTISSVAYIDLDIHEDIYCEWRLVLDGVRPGADGAQLQLRPLYSDRTLVGGSSGYTVGTVTRYGANGGYTLRASGYPLILAAGNGDDGSFTVGAGSASGEDANVVATIASIGSTTASGLTICASAGFVDTGGSPAAAVLNTAYLWNGTTEQLCDGLRVIWDSGSFAAQGTYKLYGLRRA